MARTMRILQVAHGYPPTFGGVESHVQDIARLLDERGHRVCCLVGGERDLRERDGGIEVLRHPLLSVSCLARARRPLRAADVHQPLLRQLGELVERVLREFRPEVAHFHNAHHFAPEPARAIFAAASRPPLVNGVHDRVGEQLYPEVLQLTWAHVLYASHFLRDGLHRGRGEASVAHLGIHLDRFVPDGGRDARFLRLERPVVFHPARLLRWKGVEVGLRAFDLLRKSLGGGSLVLCGSRQIVDDQTELSAFRRSLERQIAALGLRDHVHFLEFQRHRMPDAYRASDVVWYPTIDDEPFGLVPIEAMACGAPLVVSASGGMRESVEPGRSGLVVPKRDPEALAEAAVRTCRDEALRRRLIAGGLRRARAFDVRRYVDRLEGLYAAI